MASGTFETARTTPAGDAAADTGRGAQEAAETGSKAVDDIAEIGGKAAEEGSQEAGKAPTKAKAAEAGEAAEQGADGAKIAGPPEPQPLDLAAHEGPGRGHTLRKHVSRTDQQLTDRLAAEPGIPAASTFTSQAEAEAALSSVMNQRSSETSAWVANGAVGMEPFDGVLAGGWCWYEAPPAPRLAPVYALYCAEPVTVHT
jgi:hypothetical protein